MRRLRAFFLRLAGWRGLPRRERELAAEFESHLAMHIEDNLRAGMSGEQARREALVKFGGMESVKESVRDRWTLAWLETAWQDVRYAARSLRRSPAFSATTTVSLALGLGASLAIFTVADNLLLRALPYPDASQLVMIWEANRTQNYDHGVVSPGNYFDWKAQSGVFQSMAGFRERRSVLIDGDRAEEFGKYYVTAEFFQLLGVQPARGRLFTAKEDLEANSSETLVLISHRLWQSWFAGAEDAVGRKVQIDGVPHTIIGVMPQGFYFRNRDVDLWEPLGLNPAQDYRRSEGRWMLCVARMKAGITYGAAQARMTAVAARFEAAYPEFCKNWTVDVEPLRDSMLGQAKIALLVLLGAVGMLLAVACANVANLLLARYTSRRREIAVRASLGAGRSRVVRQLLTESVLLALAGGVAGLMLARWTVAGLLALAPSDLAKSTVIHFDLRILLLAVGLSVATGVFFGLLPALVSSRADLVGALRDDSRAVTGGSRMRSWLVGGEVAVSVVLLAGGLLLFRSLADLERINPGLDPSNVFMFRVSLPGARYQKVSDRRQFFASAIEQIERLPGVRSAAVMIYPPFSGPGFGTYVNLEGRPSAKPGEELTAMVRSVMPGYFRTLGIPFKSGRDFSASDDSETTPYRFIVNEAFVRQFMRGEQPLEKKISVLMESQNPFGEIVGVAGDLREWSIEREPMPTVYYVYSHFSFGGATFAVRTERNPLGFAEPVRRVIRGLDPLQPIADVRTLEEILGDNSARQRFSAVLLTGFSISALLLAAVGIYGVVAYSVAQRTREIGLRMALGAEPGRIVGLVVGTGARLVIGGAIVGMAGALALTGLLKSLLYGIGPRDPWTLCMAPVVLLSVALVAAYVPARRAARLDPMDALRTE
jgi:putative ABC transport system permease protein